jgi:hypothetical protein
MRSDLQTTLLLQTFSQYLFRSICSELFLSSEVNTPKLCLSCLVKASIDRSDTALRTEIPFAVEERETCRLSAIYGCIGEKKTMVMKRLSDAE